MQLIFILFVLCIILQLNECSHIHSHSLSKRATKQCYTCDNEECTTPTLQTCDSTSTCFSKRIVTVDGTEIQTKGCVKVDDVSSLCDTVKEKIMSCYTCDSDVCNLENGPGKCYKCNGECTVPANQEYCGNLKDYNGNPVKGVCLAIDVNGTLSKGCLTDNEDLRVACVEVNEIPGINCALCETDLCNGVEEDKRYVEQCYFCSGGCETMSYQNCSEENICVSVDYDLGGTHSISRSCNKLSVEALQNCDYLNKSGSKCKICNTDLCNYRRGGVTDTCYYCDGTCKDPVEKQDCETALGFDADSKCLGAEYVEGGKIVVSRKCVIADGSTQVLCNGIKDRGGNCTICDGELCNVYNKKNDEDAEDDKPSRSEHIYFWICSLLLTLITLRV